MDSLFPQIEYTQANGGRPILLFSNFVVATAFTLFFVLLGWRWSTRSGNTPSSIKKRLVLYGIALALGEIYLIFLFANLNWPRLLLFAAIVSWGVLLGGGVWYRAHGRRGLDVLGK